MSVFKDREKVIWKKKMDAEVRHRYPKKYQHSTQVRPHPVRKHAVLL